MKKLLFLTLILVSIPLFSFAHGAEDDASDVMPMMTQGEHSEEMETLMKKMMINGTLSEEEADRMMTIMNESMPMSEMMGMMPMMMNMMSGGMMNGSMMQSGFGEPMGMMGGGMMNMVNNWITIVLVWITLILLIALLAQKLIRNNRKQ